MRKRYEPKPHYTQEQYDKAISVNVLEFLKQRGYEFKHCGSEYHMKDHDSFVVSNNLWNWNSRGIGGNAVSFLTKVEEMSIVNAVLYLCDEEYESHPTDLPDAQKIKSCTKEILAPKPNVHSKHAFAYLMKTRMIDKEIIADMMHNKKIYESVEYFAKVKTENDDIKPGMLVNSETFTALINQKIISKQIEIEDGFVLGYDGDKLKYIGIESINDECIAPFINSGRIKKVTPVFNCVFCGYDENDELKYASMRGVTTGSKFRQDVIGSDKQYGFLMEGTSDEVFVFEAPIDALSHATLYKCLGVDWKQDSRISLGGVSELCLGRFLKKHPNIKKINFCLDNDMAGKSNVYGIYDEKKQQFTTRSLLNEYKEKGYEVSATFPATKDYNTDLISYLSEQSEDDEDDEEDEL